MNRRRHSNKLSDGSSEGGDEDVENSSILGQARSSAIAMSDWGSYAQSAGGADSTVDGGIMATSPHRTRRGMMVGEVNNLQNSAAADVDNEDQGATSAAAAARSRTSLRIFRWWSDVASRVSRSASSLLNQHSPNLNDILEGAGENPLEQPPARGVQDSIPEDSCLPVSSVDDDKEQELFDLREEVILLKKKVRELEGKRIEEISSDKTQNQANNDVKDSPTSIHGIPSIEPIQMLRPDHIHRYSRQLLLNDGFGVTGQKQLLSSSILVIGAGGIGSTVLLYLAAAGVGHITIVDYDCVEMSNLHRQVIHKDADASKSHDQVGMNKALSAKQSMLNLNPTLSCTALDVMISADNALDLVLEHDVVVDACDNPQTRYLLNDACFLGRKPLVSGSAMGTEGQLTVYNYHPAAKSPDQQKKRTACYRCLYPNPVPAEGSKSCSDNGVLGMVPGAIGVLQAVEAIKVVTGIGNIMHDRLLMYDSLHCSFLNIKKPPARPKCAVCSQHATITTMKDSEKSLENVRGPSVCAAIPVPGNLSDEQNISCAKYNEVRDQPHVLLDVRVTRQFDMCSLEGSVNLPLEQLETKLELVGELSNGDLPVYCLCRRGIFSAVATRIIQNAIEDGSAKRVHSVYNIAGGLSSWVKTVDSEFPQY
mmetsp:Transcript_24581/g.53198  ORF Transcript_24581/g.53198 Transcript_24581/m.53198 type:complete len:650 (-) Transcript_24581:194-2143(-)